MKQVKFGIGQIGAPTPKWATWTFRVVLYLCAAAIIITGAYTQIPNFVKVNIDMYCAQTILVVHAFTKMFGIRIDDDPTDQQAEQSTNDAIKEAINTKLP